MVSGTGQEGAVRNEGQGMGDVLYGMGGMIPGTALEQTGAAFASQAALQPGFTLQFGQLAAAQAMKDYVDNVLPEFTQKEAEIRMKRPSIEAELKDAKRQEAKDLYASGLITTRDYARRMGVKDWRKFPNTLPGAEEQRPKASASLSKAVGYLVDEYGQPILNAKGKPIPLPKDSSVERFGSAASGYWAWNPETGEIVNLIPPAQKQEKRPNLQRVEVNGRVYVFDPGSGLFFDPASGTPVNPNRGSGAKPPSASTLRAGWATVRLGKQGWWALQGKSNEELSASELRQILKEAGYRVGDLNSLSEEQLDEIGIAYYYGAPGELYLELVQMGIPPARAKRMVKSQFPSWGKLPPGVQINGPNPQLTLSGLGGGKGEPPKGGRKNTASTGPSSLSQDLWGLYNYGRSQGFTNLGTHNAASRLPGGGLSDHAVWPARAFDLGFSPANGWKNAKARTLFWWMTKQPGVNYVILGDKIWSRSRGLHAYTAGGHEGHIHVSGIPSGA
jgi:hypothetical protein